MVPRWPSRQQGKQSQQEQVADHVDDVLFVWVGAYEEELVLNPFTKVVTMKGFRTWVSGGRRRSTACRLGAAPFYKHTLSLAWLATLQLPLLLPKQFGLRSGT